MLLTNVFSKETIKLDLYSRDKEAAFKELVEAIAAVQPQFTVEEMLSGLWRRENKMNTSIAAGIALPHSYYPGTGDIHGALGISRAGIEYDALDHKPVHFFFLIIMGETSREKHLRVLTRILSLIKSGALADIRAAGSEQEVYDILSHFN
jgi:PTS system nitrogen regulatory IIA component